MTLLHFRFISPMFFVAARAALRRRAARRAAEYLLSMTSLGVKVGIWEMSGMVQSSRSISMSAGSVAMLDVVAEGDGPVMVLTRFRGWGAAERRRLDDLVAMEGLLFDGRR